MTTKIQIVKPDVRVWHKMLYKNVNVILFEEKIDHNLLKGQPNLFEMTETLELPQLIYKSIIISKQIYFKTYTVQTWNL